MATITDPTRTDARPPASRAQGDQCVVMRGIGWDGYTKMLRLRGDRNRPKMVYLGGDLYLMSPAFRHEYMKKRLGQFVIEVVVGLDIPCIPSGETTLRRKKKKGSETAWIKALRRWVAETLVERRNKADAPESPR